MLQQQCKGSKMADKRKGYTKRSNAVNISVWHPEGGNIPDEVAKEITDLVEEKVKEHRLLQQIVRT